MKRWKGPWCSDGLGGWGGGSAHLQLRVAFSWASSYWIVVGHFSVAAVRPSSSAAENTRTVGHLCDRVVLQLFWSAYVLLADLFPLTLKWTLLCRLCRALLFLLLLWRGMVVVRLLLKGKARSAGGLKQVWGGDGCSSDQQSERWLRLLSISGKSVFESLGVLLMVPVILSGRVERLEIQESEHLSSANDNKQIFTVCLPLSTVRLAAYRRAPALLWLDHLFIVNRWYRIGAVKGSDDGTIVQRLL